MKPDASVQELAEQFGSVVSDRSRPVHLSHVVYPDRPTDLAQFPETEVGDVKALLQRLPSCKATGSDGLPAIILHSFAAVLAPSLCKLINASLQAGYVPKVLKIADVRPLYKAGDTKLAKNYRPVSLLPLVSKILERVVYKHLQAHLASHGFIPDCQFAYRPQHSTEDALLYAVDRFIQAKDKGLHSGVVLVDMSKAFDKVQHQLLINDLRECGISKSVLAWLKSYLTDRTQRVVVPGEPPSKFSPCTCGVPQGSVLGPLLFTVYTRDVPHQLTQLGGVPPVTSQMYADDILFDVSDNSVAVINSTLTNAVSTLARYLKSRALILNETKTQVLGISGSASPLQLNVKCNGVLLQQSTSARYLGFILDDELRGTPHVAHISRKVSKKLRTFWQVRHCLTRRLAKLFYVSVLLPDVLYASTIYYPLLSAAQKAKVYSLCKRGLRCVMQAAPRTPTAHILTCLSLATLEQEVHRRTAILMYRLCNKTSSPLISSLVNTVSRAQGARTRGESSSQLHIPTTRKSAGEHRTIFIGCIIWNSLPFAVRQQETSTRFAEDIRRLL